MLLTRFLYIFCFLRSTPFLPDHLFPEHKQILSHEKIAFTKGSLVSMREVLIHQDESKQLHLY